MLAKLKPAVSRKTLLFTAAFFWTSIGCLLLYRGGKVLLHGDFYGTLTVALVFGSLKGRFVFERSAQKNIARILEKKDSICLGAVFSYKAWGLILLMIVLGRFLRSSSLPPQLYGFVIAAVGWGLLWSSLIFWREWKDI